MRNQPTLSLLGPHLNDLKINIRWSNGSRISHEPLLEGFQQRYHLSNSNTFFTENPPGRCLCRKPRLCTSFGAGQWVGTNPHKSWDRFLRDNRNPIRLMIWLTKLPKSYHLSWPIILSPESTYFASTQVDVPWQRSPGLWGASANGRCFFNRTKVGGEDGMDELRTFLFRTDNRSVGWLTWLFQGKFRDNSGLKAASWPGWFIKHGAICVGPGVMYEDAFVWFMHITWICII